MTINESLNQLYSKWEKNHPGEHLVRHGLVDEGTYRNAEPRIVLLGREVNAMKEPHFNLLEYLIYTIEKSSKSKGFKLGEKQAGLWAYGILKGFPDYHKLELDLNSYAAEGIRSIGWTNLSKIAGCGKANLAQVKKRACDQQDLLREELRLMDPYVILCVGTGTHNLMAKLLGTDQVFLLNNTELRREIYYSIWHLENHKCLCVDFFHHADRRGYEKLYKILKEVFNKCEKLNLFTWK